MQFRVSGAMLFVGISCGIVYEVIRFRYVAMALLAHCDITFQDHLLQMLQCMLFFCRVLMMALAPLADAIWLTRMVLLTDAVIIVADFFIRLRDGMPFAEQVSTCINAIFVAGALTAMCQRTAREVQRTMWKAMALWLALGTASTGAFSVKELFTCHTFTTTWWWPIFSGLSLVVTLKSSWRAGIQALFVQVLQAHTAKAAAAGIAGLVGKCDVKEVLAQAKARFRCVRIADLCHEDLADNKPNPVLFERTFPCRLGECDAFVSHSWHDCAATKWAALQSWRAAFLERHKREPRIWFDKCCIDQNNIEADLRCLPIFLSGCTKMVVLCGSTYLSRLWCIIELFAYVHTGGTIENIEFLPVLNNRFMHDEEMGDLEVRFERFDARNCQCFLPEEKDAMLCIICAAFGCMEVFNGIIRDIVSRSGWSDFESTCSGSSSSSPEDSSKESP